MTLPEFLADPNMNLPENKIRFDFKENADQYLVGQLVVYLHNNNARYQFFLSGICLHPDDHRMHMAVALRFGELFVL